MSLKKPVPGGKNTFSNYAWAVDNWDEREQRGHLGQKGTVEDLVCYILAVYSRKGQCSHEEEGSFNGSQGVLVEGVLIERKGRVNIRRIAGGARARGNGDERVQRMCSHEEGLVLI